MSLAYRISPVGAYVRIVGTGKITTDDCIRLVKRLLHDPRRRPNSTALIDLRNAIYTPDHDAEVIYVGQALKAFHFTLRNKVAIVAKQSMIFPAEILSTYVRKVTHLGIMVFADLGAARAFCRGKRQASNSR
jgi:hypothetical protein